MSWLQRGKDVAFVLVAIGFLSEWWVADHPTCVLPRVVSMSNDSIMLDKPLHDPLDMAGGFMISDHGRYIMLSKDGHPWACTQDYTLCQRESDPLPPLPLDRQLFMGEHFELPHGVMPDVLGETWSTNLIDPTGKAIHMQHPVR